MAIALRAAGVQPGDRVLTNSFTLAPVPGAIAAVGSKPVLVEIDENLILDLDDLKRKLQQSAPKAVLLSNMRGHLCDMVDLSSICREAGIPLIEDCAHTMGAAWNGKKSGSFGLFGCFSTQTYKHLNSGEGGLLVSDDAEAMAKAIMLSGSYMLYERHGAAPTAEVFKDIRLDMPNMSSRMDNLRAAILLPQLQNLDASIDAWNERYDALASGLKCIDGVVLADRPTKESYVGSSIQFRLPDADEATIRVVVRRAAELGGELKGLGSPEPVCFTSMHQSWRYMQPQRLPQTDRILATLLDMRVPLTFDLDDCKQIVSILDHVIAETWRMAA